MPPHDDEELEVHLVRAMAEGSAAACEALYDLHGPRLLGVLVQMVGDRERAEDVLQDAFVQAWRTASRFDPARSRVGAWLLLIARSRALDRIRAEARRPPLIAEPATAEAGADPAAADATDALDTRMDVGQAMQALSHQERQVLALAYWQGLTQVEMAQRLGIPLGTVKGRVRSALAHLKRVVVASEEVPS